MPYGSKMSYGYNNHKKNKKTKRASTNVDTSVINKQSKKNKSMYI